MLCGVNVVRYVIFQLSVESQWKCRQHFSGKIGAVQLNNILATTQDINHFAEIKFIRIKLQF